MAGSRLLVCAAVLGLLCGPALAQVATSSGSRVVTDPETRRVRVINPELDRPDPYEGQTGMAVSEPIILKKPQKKKPRPAPPKPAPSLAETPQAEPEPAAEPAVQASPSSSLGAEDYVSPFGDAEPAPAPPPKKPVEKPKPAPKAAPAESEIPFSFGGQDSYAHPRQQQAAAPHAASGNLMRGDNGKTRNIRINFIAGKAEPSAEVATALQALAQDLTRELQAKPGRLLLQAYAGAKGDKSSDARRLSLKRALSVRQLLIDSGVPSDRIDVRAMGGASDGDRLDRVDVSLHG
ncbi:MAG TPA: OmpA family protein [Rhizomicrobium sp.]|nr:OmpA family protein [Rhizomicrobium sp.]